MFVTVANILAAGVKNKGDKVRELPIRLLLMNKASRAISCLHKEKIHAVINRRELLGVANSELLKRQKQTKPHQPTIAFIEPGNKEQEITARSLGVSVVLPENIDDGYFRKSICQLLGLTHLTGIKAVNSPQEDSILREENNKYSYDRQQ